MQSGQFCKAQQSQDGWSMKNEHTVTEKMQCGTWRKGPFSNVISHLLPCLILYRFTPNGRKKILLWAWAYSFVILCWHAVTILCYAYPMSVFQCLLFLSRIIVRKPCGDGLLICINLCGRPLRKTAGRPSEDPPQDLAKWWFFATDPHNTWSSTLLKLK